MRMVAMRSNSPILIFAICLLAGLCPLAAQAMSPDVAAGWREDLEFLRAELVRVHPDPFHSISAAEFDASVDALEARLPELQPYQAVVELARIIASIEDGHTRLTLPMVDGSGFFAGHSSTAPPKSDELLLHYLPIRFALLEDGLFVEESGEDLARLVGARVVRIGELTAAEAMERVAPVVHRDNEWQVRTLLPSRLVVPEILQALGVCEDAAEVAFEFLLEDGSIEKLLLEPVAPGEPIEWKHRAGPIPLYRRHPEKNFWFELLAPQRLVYCQYNEVDIEDDETVAAFAERLSQFVDESSVETLVLDLRFNRGGDNSLNRSFLHALLRCEKLRNPGSLFVILGRDTFSAALMFALDLEKHTNAIFVGEPTGGRPNHYGDSRKVELPRTGLTVRVSTLYWQYGGPKDDRDAVHPHLRVGIGSKDLREGRDPALERIVELGSAVVAESPAGAWRGRALGYDMVVRVQPDGDGWKATLDLPGAGYSGLELVGVRFEDGALQFQFPNGDSSLEFEGLIRSDYFVGQLIDRGESHALLMVLER